MYQSTHLEVLQARPNILPHLRKEARVCGGRVELLFDSDRRCLLLLCTLFDTRLISRFCHVEEKRPGEREQAKKTRWQRRRGVDGEAGEGSPDPYLWSQPLGGGQPAEVMLRCTVVSGRVQSCRGCLRGGSRATTPPSNLFRHPRFSRGRDSPTAQARLACSYHADPELPYQAGLQPSYNYPTTPIQTIQKGPSFRRFLRVAERREVAA